MKRLFLTVAISVAAITSAAAQATAFSDNFEVRRLDTGHFKLWDDDVTIVNMGTRGLTVMAGGESPKDGNVVYFTAQGTKWEAEANVVLYPTSRGGLVLMQDREHYWGVTADYKNICLCDGSGVKAKVSNPYGRYLHLKLAFDNGTLSLYAAPQKTRWTIVANDNPRTGRKPADRWRKIGSFTVAPTDGAYPDRVCLTAMAQDVVSFRDFWYR